MRWPQCLLCGRDCADARGLHKHLSATHGATAWEYYLAHPVALRERLHGQIHKIVRVERLGECWEWTGLLSPGGYGRLRVAGAATCAAHRFSVFCATGRLPSSDLFILHQCDNPPCIRPDHLKIGTGQQNVDERVERGRSSRGEHHYRAKLTDAEALAIRREAEHYRLVDLASKYEVSPQAIQHVVARRTFAHLPDEPSDEFVF